MNSKTKTIKITSSFKYRFISPNRNSGTLPESTASKHGSNFGTLPESTASERGSLPGGAPCRSSPKRTCSWGDAELAFRGARKQKKKKKKSGGGHPSAEGARLQRRGVVRQHVTDAAVTRPPDVSERAPSTFGWRSRPFCHVHHP
ncbi:hypothetical protein CEXT_729361 [Caerostris extrusa]|uniref:Uncharacterized protein n=1 Tax=Caerostris extrusa TaxID=172846 RepID=A0AAV4NE38_CAEEX|nr:hypothetical protein CEXT_729361 [Caerostris extrusa]